MGLRETFSTDLGVSCRSWEKTWLLCSVIPPSVAGEVFRCCCCCSFPNLCLSYVEQCSAQDLPCLSKFAANFSGWLMMQHA
ncbi:hypothetical protein MPTK1_5g04490 [Marchantia polymorpha subsp. ruderalis]|uniref:Uncharacterized protein n=2 Tax=Marchantia polymorpha TaxID=3197 RepID=A0AAF6BEX2_MARPO|nr:hypothetical protein MARPO_0027s0177 [Marchantia polymorpha]BBN10556.1 hypothetical protein Mp_5g04490 [Marchantia polymorpha subsp. ruderalis]|eukprot:PTQ43079.1 hypothetical protein MARPO_0027s0177 [Marchantia polymorpha]